MNQRFKPVLELYENASTFIQKNYQSDAYFLEGGTIGWFEEI